MSSRESEAARIFLEAVEHHEPGHWAAFAREAAAEDPLLLQRVEALLKAHGEANQMLDGDRLLPTGDLPQPSEGPGTVFGQYKLLEQIGEGGFGVVYLAEQAQPVRRKVALKVLKPGMDSRQVITRFEAERQALALMEHPNIAQVLDGGQTALGRPYFVMELVKGIAIAEFSDQSQLSVPERLRLFVAVCQAVQHAHQKGIIHRDLKPSNVLVTLHDGSPLVKVIDFGIAKALGQQLTDRTLCTGFAQLLGTPLYMSPEQTALSSDDVDTRSDIYTLGVLLYELLTGTTPFDKDRLKALGYDEMRRVLREEEPPRPSTCLSTLRQAATVAAQRQSDPHKLSRLLRGELDWIVMKCLEKDRNRRYETVGALAADVQHYLRDEPVQACPPSTAYRFQKFARRNKRALVMLTLLGVTLLTAVVGLSLALVAVNRAGDKARAALDAEARRRKQARAALDSMTSEVLLEWFEKQEALSPEQQQFLERALTSYEEFAADTGQDVETRAGVAGAYRRVGLIRYQLNRMQEAEAALQRSRDEYARLASEFPAELEYRSSLALVVGDLGEVARFTGRQHTAQEAYRQALALYRQLAVEFPTEAQIRREWALLTNKLGSLLMISTRFQEAEAALEEARAVQEQLALDLPSEPIHQRDLASTYMQLARLFANTGQVRRWEECLNKALDLRKQLVAAYPRSPSDRSALASAHSERGYFLARTGRPKEAETAYRIALGIRNSLSVEFPAKPGYSAAAAETYDRLGVLLENVQPQRAATLLQQAIGLYRQLADDYPTMPTFRLNLGRSQNNLGLLYQHQKVLPEAEQCYKHALACYKQLPSDFPSTHVHRREVAGTSNNLAMVLQAAGRLHDAEGVYRGALNLRREIAGEAPKNPAAQNDVAGTLVNLARLRRAQGDPQGARRLLEEALPFHEAALRANPRDPTYRLYYRNNRWHLTAALVELKDHAAAAVAADEYRKAAVKPAEDAFRVAYFLANCVRLAQDDQRLADRGRAELADYGKRAVAAFRQGLEEFRKLLADAAAKKK
jgi:serine/threonine protein kinase/tetratricopeptide (TPR) repeat protein